MMSTESSPGAVSPVPFVIVAGLRTGSTLLSTSLDSHPSIRCYGELFHERDFPDNQVPGCDRHQLPATAVIARMLEVAEPGSTVGFRAMLGHPGPSRPGWASLWEDLRRLPMLRVVHLERRDWLAQYASLMIAKRTGVFHPSPECPAPARRPTIRIDPEEFQRWADGEMALRSARERTLAGLPCLRVHYEDLANSWEPTIRRLLGFLDVPRTHVPQSRTKQEHRPLCDVIVNFEQVVSFRGSTSLPRD
jgi:hypothetical protein